MDDIAPLAAQTLAQDGLPSPEHNMAPSNAADTAEPVFYREFDGVDLNHDHHRRGDSDDDDDGEDEGGDEDADGDEDEKEDGEGNSDSDSSYGGRHHRRRRRRRHRYGKHDGCERVRRPLPPLPDLRFEQSYLASIAPAKGVWWKIGLITAKDQVLLPLLQGLAFNLVLFGWRWWNRGVKFRGAGLGGTSLSLDVSVGCVRAADVWLPLHYSTREEVVVGR